MNNPIKTYFKKLNRFNYLLLNNVFNNIVYGFLLFLIVAFIVLIIVFTVVSTKENPLDALLWTAISLFIFDLVAFYIYQFLRRKVKFNLEDKINFKWLYEDNLIENKLIDNGLNYDNLDDQFYINLHVELMQNLYETSTLGSQYETYSYTRDDLSYKFSICNIKTYTSKFFKPYTDNLQLIFKNTHQKLNTPNLFLTKTMFENIQTKTHLFNLAKQENINNVFTYYNPKDIDQQEITKLVEIINNFNQENVNLSIRIINNELYFIFHTKLQINFEKQNWFSKSQRYFIDLYEQYNEIVLSIFKNANY